MTNREKLSELMKDYDIPEYRKEINFGNVSWMTRNIAIRNKNNPNFEKVWKLVKIVYKELYKEICSNENLGR